MRSWIMTYEVKGHSLSELAYFIYYHVPLPAFIAIRNLFLVVLAYTALHTDY